MQDGLIVLSFIVSRIATVRKSPQIKLSLQTLDADADGEADVRPAPVIVTRI
jgi:hypothetical protein